MRLICPNCMKTVDVADELAGKEAECPACHRAFAAPARYNPVVAVDPPPAAPEPPPPPPAAADPTPAPPPGYVPPVERPTAAGGDGTLPLPPGGYAKSASFSIPRAVFDWLPAGCLVAVCLLSFLNWTGFYPAGSSAYYQGPWRMVVGWFGWDNGLEDELKLYTELKQRVPSNWLLMVPYLTCLFAAAGLAVAERVVRNPPVERFPPWLASAWPHRLAVIAALGGVALACVFAQAAAGFGLERGLKDYARAHFADQWAEAGDNEAKRFRVEVRESMFVGQYRSERTVAYTAAIWLNALALFGLAARVRFDRRGAAPPPRITVQY